MSVAFPTGYYLTKDTNFDVDLGVSRDPLDDGSLQIRILSETPYSTISCRLPLLTQSEANTLMTFLQTNRATDITMTIDGVNYIGQIASNIQKTMRGNRYNIAFDYYAKAA